MPDYSIDTMEIERLIYSGARTFCCESDQERVPFLSALDELGYEWLSGHKLLDMKTGNYLVINAPHGFINYTLHSDMRVGYGREDEYCDVYVRDLFEPISEIDLMEVLI